MNVTLSSVAAPTTNVEPPTGNYFVAAYPPFSAWSTSQVLPIESSLPKLAIDTDVPWGVYLHLPFCEKRCDYCYYLSFSGKPRGAMVSYAEQLIQECLLYSALPRFAARAPRFVYFGGGTPSLLSADVLRGLLSRLAKGLRWESAEEITFECSPKSITREKLAILHAAGVNRISLGVQQLDDAVLRQSGRIHLVADVLRAITAVRELDFEELNVDLIAGLPGQSDASFMDGLVRIIDLKPDCVTLYQLEIPTNTPLYRSVAGKETVNELADWESKRQRVLSAFELLQQNGYSMRNAYSAATGARHRRFAYVDEQYRGCDLIGLGLSSFSYVDGMHFQNTLAPDTYRQAVEAGRFPIARGCRLTSEERMIREFALQLKSGQTSRAYFRQKFDTDPVERFAFVLGELAAEGWLTWEEESVRLTPSGLVRVDRLLPAFYLKQHQDSSYW